MTAAGAGGTQGVEGIHHLALTVSDLDVSVPWYCEVLGMCRVGERRHAEGDTVELAGADGAFTILLQEHKAHEGAGFSEFRPGLDHLAFRVADLKALEAWETRLAELGVDHRAPQREPSGWTVVLRDPDRIRLELFVEPDDA